MPIRGEWVFSQPFLTAQWWLSEEVRLKSVHRSKRWNVPAFIRENMSLFLNLNNEEKFVPITRNNKKMGERIWKTCKEKLPEQSMSQSTSFSWYNNEYKHWCQDKLTKLVLVLISIVTILLFIIYEPHLGMVIWFNSPLRKHIFDK